MKQKKIGSCLFPIWPHHLEIRPFRRLCLKKFWGDAARAGCFCHLEEPALPPASPRLPVLPGIRSTMQQPCKAHVKKATRRTLALVVWITNATASPGIAKGQKRLQRSWPALDAYSFFPCMTPRLTMNNRNISMTFHIYAVFFLSSTPAAMLVFPTGIYDSIRTNIKVISMGVIESPTF